MLLQIKREKDMIREHYRDDTRGYCRSPSLYRLNAAWQRLNSAVGRPGRAVSNEVSEGEFK